MLMQLNYSSQPCLAMWYQGHLIVPAYASTMKFEYEGRVIYPFSENALQFPKLLDNYRFISERHLANGNLEALMSVWSIYGYLGREAVWIAYNKDIDTLSYFTPSTTKLNLAQTIANGAIVLEDEGITVGQISKSDTDLLLSPYAIALSSTDSSILESGILTPQEVASRMIPRLSRNLPEYTVIQL